MSRMQVDGLAVKPEVVEHLTPALTADLTICDREPIHLPGAIQPHGALLAVDEADLTIRQASANCAALLGIEAPTLLNAPLADALGADFVRRLRGALVNPRASGADPLVVRLLDDRSHEATWHRIDGLVVVELEATEAPDGATQATLFQDIRHAMDALRTAESVQALSDAAVSEIRQLTGYDRVMVYRFHPDDHGEVVAESREPGHEPFLGLHYPASDIPVQARRLYTLNHLRVIGDVDYEPVTVLGASGADSGTLDLSFAGLRSVSPLHLAYLRNMGVRATLTISLLREGRLWGLIACHHDAPRYLGAQLRAACQLFARVFSLHLATEEHREHGHSLSRLSVIQAEIIAGMSGEDRLADALAAASRCPLDLVNADGMVARLDGRTVTIGEVPPAEAVDALIGHLGALEDTSALVCDEVPWRFAELEPYLAHTAGVLAVSLSPRQEDVILWFRDELIRTVSWAGDPEKPMRGEPLSEPGGVGFADLKPRESFKAWAQEVRGRSRPWLPAEVDAALELAGSVQELLLSGARDRVAHLALHDALTGLPNRVLLSDRIAQALAGPHRRGRRVALLFVDLDRFKFVNDSLGHAAGDEVLCQAAERLQLATRDTDTVARFGGDEFVVLCADITLSQAERIAQRIVQAFQVPIALGDQEAVVTSSVGIVLAEAGSTPAGLLHDADTAMYRSKNRGRNASTPFTPEMRAAALRGLEIETGLGPALDRGELRLNFQPIHTITGELTGFEALARWPRPGREMIPPAEFIPVAEATGLIAPLTAWVLDDGLGSLARWREQRPDLDLTLSVNVSASQVTPALVPLVGKALARYALPSAAVCLEITEGALVSDNELTRRILHDLRDQGIQLSIDDFGTGFSSLAYLVQLPVQEIKIDRAFISGLPARRSDATVVASVVGLAHQLGFRALAEGVETDEQLQAVRRLGCDRAQGYLLGRPMAPEAIDRLLAAPESKRPEMEV